MPSYTVLDASIRSFLHAALVGRDPAAVVEVMATTGAEPVAELVDEMIECFGPPGTARYQTLCAAVHATWTEALQRYQTRRDCH